MAATNPFTPTFGFVPPFMAGREELVEELSAAFSNGIGDPNLSTIISGARGSGKGDKAFLFAMLPDEKGSSLADVAAHMGVKSNYASQYRRRLLEQGVIGEPCKGFVHFELPMLREYLQEQRES